MSEGLRAVSRATRSFRVEGCENPCTYNESKRQASIQRDDLSDVSSLLLPFADVIMGITSTIILQCT